MSNEYSTGIHSPSEFKNVDELISWFENEYKPVVYKAIKRHLKEFKEKYRKTIKIFKR
jgi:rRNA-processing protein FCF1